MFITMTNFTAKFIGGRILAVLGFLSIIDGIRK
jgi:hypothetical protein